MIIYRIYIIQYIYDNNIQNMQDTIEYDKDYMKMKFESNNIFPTDKDVNIHMGTIIIKAIFAQDGKYYPQLFLDDGLYKNVRI